MWALAGVVLCGVVVAVLLSTGGDGSAEAGGYTRTNRDSCVPGAARTSLCPREKFFKPETYLEHGDAYDCVEFASQADAQAVLRADPSDPNHLDGADQDGVACPGQISYGPTDLTPVKAIAAAHKCVRSDMRSALCPHARRFKAGYFVRFQVDEYDCARFASQADAQAVLRYMPNDPNKLDADGDGIACPDLPAPKDLGPVITRAPS